MTRHAFDEFVLDTDDARLLGPDGPIDVEPQVFDVLALLVARAGSLVTKNELLDTVWGDRFVSESTLSSRVSSARAAIGDSGREQRLVRTVHGRGYRFQGTVTALDDPAGDRPVRDGGDGGPPGAVAPRTGTGTGTGTGSGARPTPGRAPPVPPAPPFPPSLAAMRRRPLVGRDPELARLVGLLDDHEGLRVGWVVGEPGIGKSRLVAEVAGMAAGRGREVLLGRCSPDLAVPWQPAIEALEAWLARRPGVDATDLVGPDDRDLLARLVPAVAPGRVEPGPVDLDGERYRLHKAFGRWLAVACAATPDGGGLAWVVDDLHWGAPSTLQVLQHLVAECADLDLVVLVTARDTAPDDREEVRRLQATATRAGVATVVELDGLGLDGVAALCGPEDVAEEVRRRTAGNPLLVQAAVAEAGGDLDLDRVVARRLARLAPDTPAVLTVAAVAGEQFEVDLLATATDRAEDAVLDALDEADAAGLVVEVEADRYQFTHALVRDALRGGTSRTRRRRIHRRLADALADRPGPGRVPAARILHHLEAGGMDAVASGRLVELAIAAADHDADQLDVDGAMGHLDRALAHLDGRDDHRAVGRVGVHRGAVLARLGLDMPAVEAYDGAFRGARAVDEVATLVDAAIGLEAVAWRPGLHGGRALHRVEAAAAALHAEDRHDRARLAIAAGRAHAFAGATEASRQAFATAQELVDQLGDPWLEADLLAARLTRLWADEDALAAAERLGSLGRRLDSVEHLSIALEVQVCELQRRGDAPTARIRLAALRDHVHQHGSRFWTYVVATHEASDALFRGDLAEAEAAQERARRLGAQQVDQDTGGIDALRGFLLRRERDDLRRLAPLIRQLAGDAPAGSVWVPGRALLLAEIGDLAAARAALDELALEDDAVEDALWPMVLCGAAEVVHRTGDRTLADVLLPHAARHGDRFLVVGNDVANLGPARRLVGLLHAVRGDHAAADAELAAAQQASTAAGSPLHAGWCALHRAEVAGAAGRDEDLAQHLAVVAAVVADHDLPALRRRADEVAAAS